MELVLKEIKKIYDNKVVINNFTYTFKTGMIYSILGNNGSGKTTLIKIIATLIPIDSGVIKKNEMMLRTNQSIKKFRLSLSVMNNSESSLVNGLTIMQNIKFFLKINNFDYNKCCAYIDELIDGFGLKEYLLKPVKYLSKGTRQKIAIIIAIMRKTDIILLDEPFDGLDKGSTEFLKKILENLSKNSIVIITMPKEIENFSYERILI